jgi:hypothetical protein
MLKTHLPDSCGKPTSALPMSRPVGLIKPRMSWCATPTPARLRRGRVRLPTACPILRYPAISRRPARHENGRLRIGEIELSEQDVRGLLERKGLEDSRRATMPASAAEYQLPTDMPMPPGMSWKWNTEDPVLSPLIGQVKEWAFAHGVDQPGFNKLVGTWVAHELAGQARFEQAQKAEREKLGQTAPLRISAIETFFNAHLGTESAKALTQTLFTAAQVQAFEKLMHTFVSQGSGGFNGAHREPGVVVLFDFGPQPPPMAGVPDQADAKRMRKYAIERAEWERETGNKPVDVGFNSVDASAAKLYDPKRWRSSATATAEDMEVQVGPQPRGITGTLVNWNTSGVMQACWLVYDLITNQTFVVDTASAREWIERDQRYSRAFL